MYYHIFLQLLFYLVKGCAFIDFYKPELRYTTKKNEDILGDYKKMIPVVGKNLMISFPVFSLCEYYLFDYPEIKNNVYKYHWFVYIL